VTNQKPTLNVRVPDYPAEQIFVNRWSARGFAQDQIQEETLNTFFEAARWAPSAFNSQPWRFLYALRGQSEFDAFLAPLAESNQRWTRYAAALIYLLSKKYFIAPGKAEQHFSRTHSFDTGAAWANFANQAAADGWVAHGIGGFDVAKARTELRVPEGFVVEIAIAIGRKGDGSQLEPALLRRETPTDRSRISDFVACGLFSSKFES